MVQATTTSSSKESHVSGEESSQTDSQVSNGTGNKNGEFNRDGDQVANINSIYLSLPLFTRWDTLIGRLRHYNRGHTTLSTQTPKEDDPMGVYALSPTSSFDIEHETDEIPDIVGELDIKSEVFEDAEEDYDMCEVEKIPSSITLSQEIEDGWVLVTKADLLVDLHIRELTEGESEECMAEVCVLNDVTTPDSEVVLDHLQEQHLKRVESITSDSGCGVWKTHSDSFINEPAKEVITDAVIIKEPEEEPTQELSRFQKFYKNYLQSCFKRRQNS